MKIELKFFFVKYRMRDAATDLQSLYKQSNVNKLFFNVIYHLDNASIPYKPFGSPSFDVRA